MERHYTRLPERLGAGKSKTRAACHGGGSGGSYDLSRRYPAENYLLWRDNLSGKRTYTECSSRSGSGGPLRRGRVAAQCRLSAPNAEGKQKRHCAIKLNANGRLDNLLSAIRRSSPHEAGGGTRTQVLTEQAPGKPDQTRSIPRKGYLCPQKRTSWRGQKSRPRRGGRISSEFLSVCPNSRHWG